MNTDLKSIIFNVIGSVVAALIGGGSVWLYNRWKANNLREKRLQAITRISRDDEIAICVRVGGISAALPDVEDYLKRRLPNVTTVLSYDVASSDLRENENLDQPQIAARVTEDIIEGLRAYGKGKLTRIHFFPSGLVAYVPIVTTVLSNWGRIVVYHRTGSDYVPLYEISKDTIHQTKRLFPPMKTWQTLQIQKP